MTGKSNRVLAIALAISLVVHAFVALFARYRAVEAAPEPPLQHVTIATIPKRMPPPPTPKPHDTPPASKASSLPPTHPTIKAPVTNASSPPGGVTAVSESPGPVSSGDPGTDVPGATAAPATPQPTPSPTPKPQCATPYEAARALTTVEPVAPADADAVNATVQVQVTLSATGSVVSASVFRSANNFGLDRAALVAARASKYAPEIQNCQPQGGTYLFTATFQN